MNIFTNSKKFKIDFLIDVSEVDITKNLISTTCHMIPDVMGENYTQIVCCVPLIATPQLQLT